LLRTYFRKVDLYDALTRTPKERRAGKLLMNLTGKAFERTEMLDIKTLMNDHGVALFKDYLKNKFEPVETQRVGLVADELLYEFERRYDEEIVDYDTRFQATVHRAEALLGPLNATWKAHIFLKKAKLSSEKCSQVVTGAMNQYTYEGLRDSMLACIPRVKELRRGRDGPAGDSYNTQGRHHNGGHGRERGGGAHRWKSKKRSHGAHMTGGDTEQADDSFEDEGSDNTGAEDEPQDQDAGVMGVNLPEELAQAWEESEIYMTQARKQRAEIEKARDFYKNPKKNGGKDKSQDDRMKQLKLRLPCMACGALGHWKDDKECPKKGAGGAKGSHKANMVMASGMLEDEDEQDFSDEEAALTLTTEQNGKLRTVYKHGLMDTACAKTVAGYDWWSDMQQYIAQHGGYYRVVAECEPFRFGPGKRVMSTHAVVIAISVQGRCF